jgi:hypothetical protein
LSSIPIEKLYVINKFSPTTPNIIDPSHLILNIQLNNLGSFAILDTGNRYCYMSKQFAADNNIKLRIDPKFSPIQNLNENTLSPNQLKTVPINITDGPITILFSFKIIEAPTPTILGLNWLLL